MKRLMKQTLYNVLALLLVLQMLASLQPLHASVSTEPVTIASYMATANAVIDQQEAYRDTHYSQKHQGTGSVLAYNVKTGNGSERQAYFQFALPDSALVEEADTIYLSIKGKSNNGQGELDFTVYGVSSNDWSASFAEHHTVPEAGSSLITWNNAPARYNSQKVAGSDIGFETSSDDVIVQMLGTFTTNEVDNEYRIDVTEFVKAYGDTAVSFLVRGSKTNASTIYNSFNDDNIANGTYGSTNKKPALILVQGEPAFTLQPYPLIAASVTASGDDGNIAANTIDNNTYTRWSAQNMAGAPLQWIQFDLGSVKPVGYLGISFYNGASRVSVFDIAVSDDGEHWTTVLEQAESAAIHEAQANEVQAVDLHSYQLAARYVRYIGHGNLSSNPAQVDWNSLTEFQIYKPHPEQLPLVVQAPYIEPEVPDAEPFTVPGLHLPDGTPYTVHTPNVTTGDRLNVVDFGADPADNDHDDTAAIIAAFQAAKSGDEVYLPNGVYNLITKLDATTNFELKSGVNLIGESQEGVILLSYLNEKGNTRVIKAFNKNNIKIANMTITSIFERSGKQFSTTTTSENPDIGGFGNGIYIDQSGNKGSHHITIEHVTIEHFQRMGIRINKSHNITVRDSTFRKATDVGAGGAGYGIAIQGEPKRNPLGEDIDTYFVLVENNTFEGPYLRHGVIVQYYAHNNLVRHNHFDGTLLDAIDLHGEDEYLNEIAYNFVENVPFGGIGVGNTGGTPPTSNHDESGPFNYIHHNTVKNTRDGILVYMGSPDTIIEANTISNTTDYANAVGIKLLHAPRTIVKDNIIENNTAPNFWGILLAYDQGDLNLGGAYAGDPVDVQIIGNTITGNSNGLKIEAGNGHIVRDNMIADNTHKNWSITIPFDHLDTDLTTAEEDGEDTNNGGSDGGSDGGSTGGSDGGSDGGSTGGSDGGSNGDSNNGSSSGNDHDSDKEAAEAVIELVDENNIIVRSAQWIKEAKEVHHVTVTDRQLQEALAVAAAISQPRISLDLEAPFPYQELSISLPVTLIEAAAKSNAAISYTIVTAQESLHISNEMLRNAYRTHPAFFSTDNGTDDLLTVTLLLKQLPVETVSQMTEAAEAAKLQLSAAAMQYELLVTTADTEDKLPVTAAADTKNGIPTNTSASAVNEQIGNVVSRTIILPKAVTANKATVLRYNPQDNSFSFVPALFVWQDGKQRAVFQADDSSIYIVAEGSSSFSDLDNHYAKTSIEQLAAKQIIKGVSSTSFAPQQSITRAQFAALLTRALGLDASKQHEAITDSVALNDVDRNAWYFEAVQQAVAYGLLRGTGEHSFVPEQELTREQLAVIVMNVWNTIGYAPATATIGSASGSVSASGSASAEAMQAEASEAEAIQAEANEDQLAASYRSYSDAELISNWARQAVEDASSNGLMVGQSSAHFVPKKHVSRAEAVVVLTRLMKLLGYMN